MRSKPVLDVINKILDKLPDWAVFVIVVVLVVAIVKGCVTGPPPAPVL